MLPKQTTLNVIRAQTVTGVGNCLTGAAKVWWKRLS